MSYSIKGGYYTLRSNAIIHRFDGEHTAGLERPVGPKALAALNFVQQTKWRINLFVMTTLDAAITAGVRVGGLPNPDDLERPARVEDDVFAGMTTPQRREHIAKINAIHDANAEARSARATVYRRSALARDLSRYPTLWFPHTLDFRGRVYPIPQDLTPQGDSLSKGLLEFATGAVLDDRGRYWLRVAFANAMGHDKLPLDERAAWAEKQTQEALWTASNPLDMTGFWDGPGVDSPWEALALAHAIAADSNGEAVHAPVRLDATCSGIQHLAALMKDSLAASAVNVVPTGRREDIYGDVAAITMQRVSNDAAVGNELAHLWVGQISRKTVKRAIMTTPYGVTPRGITEQLVLDGHCDHMPGAMRYKAASYLKDMIVGSMDSTIGAPRRAMRYFQETAAALADRNIPLTWETPAGMTVRQAYVEQDSIRAKTLLGTLRLLVPNPDADLMRRKQAASSAPNVVHSFDAAHLMLTSIACRDAGIKDLALVHDSYGTHANDVDLLSRLTREQFAAVYGQPQLEMWRESVIRFAGTDDIPSVPPLGELDVSVVLESPFFFS